MTRGERIYLADQIRSIARRLDAGERDTDFVLAALDPIELRCLVVVLLREVAEVFEREPVS